MVIKKRPALSLPGFAAEHRALIAIVVVAVGWLLIECAILLPGLIARYGWH